MSKVEIAAQIEAAQMDSNNLDYRRLTLERQVTAAQQEIADIGLKLAYLKGRADALAEMMKGEEEAGDRVS